METEKWVCSECGSDCRIEIDFDKTGYSKGAQRRIFNGCVAGEPGIIAHWEKSVQSPTAHNTQKIECPKCKTEYKRICECDIAETRFDKL